MSNFKQASKLKLRFHTDKGILSVEQLWDLSQASLASLITSIKKVLKQNDGDDELAFLTETKVVDTENQLRYDLTKEVYLAKKAELDEKRDSATKKEHNQKILGLIKEKQDGALAGKSIEELEKMLQ